MSRTTEAELRFRAAATPASADLGRVVPRVADVGLVAPRIDVADIGRRFIWVPSIGTLADAGRDRHIALEGRGGC
eukprot:315524-Amphidinium_carterae.1